MTENELRENMEQYYIAPAKEEGGRYYQIFLTYQPTIQMANMHAYKTIHALREISDSILYFPNDIMTNEDSAEEIVKNGFNILIATGENEERIRKIVRPGYDLERVDIKECSKETFEKGFYDRYPENRIGAVLDELNTKNHVQDVIDTANDHNCVWQDIEAQKRKICSVLDFYGWETARRRGCVRADSIPGDYVISERTPGKAIRLAKDEKEQESPHVSIDERAFRHLLMLSKRLAEEQERMLSAAHVSNEKMPLFMTPSDKERLGAIAAELRALVDGFENCYNDL